jgi:uncharacterized protein YndB with AHSA1/START domain
MANDRHVQVPLAPEITRVEKTITRTFAAPIELVWEAWTDPVKLQQWWGPAGFTNPLCIWEAIRGGSIRIDMQAPDGTVYPMDGSMQELEPLRKIYFISRALDTNGMPIFEVHNTVHFETEGHNTLMKLHLVVNNISDAARPYLGGMEMGWSGSLDKLQHFLKH